MLQPKDIDWLNGYKNKTLTYAAYKRPTSNLRTQTENEGIEKDIPCKWKSKESRSSNSHIRQNRFKNEVRDKTNRGALYNDKGINPRTGYIICKHICT